MIRDGNNTIYELPDGIVARIGRTGTSDIARREVQVSHWLTAEAGIRVVQAVPGLPQPVVIEDRPVTWWTLIPKHRSGSPAELGTLLAILHSLPAPTAFELPIHDPFHGISQRLDTTDWLGQADREWFVERLTAVRDDYTGHNHRQSRTVIHGDAWQGNVAVTEDGHPVLLDLENVALGHPDHDLIDLAVDYLDFARLTQADYESFVKAYGGHDVTESPGYRTLADLQELRWLSFVMTKAADDPAAAEEVRHRIACLRGEEPRPWTWTAF
ncbi:phosphotransferase family protein [Amycolatopsis sp. H20-H5]|uniref:phosphotransferase family protein n=1 Tax=Amycolatopsis sp. H20-H5 TaxID=3046309 RepID=UPI002DB73C19|nr:phosphotransferase [Amycolatopsis sp. H20-H5]MEC3979295.1 phosphotransferase [Amycolatopsis sp. H20-H5]